MIATLVLLLASLWSDAATQLHDMRVDALSARVVTLGDIATSADVGQHVRAAIDVETAHVTAELLLSIAWSESRLDASARAGRVCGPLQVAPGDLGLDPDSACAAWQADLVDAYAAGVMEIEIMLRDARVHGALHLALAYRACGNAAFVPDSACARAKRTWPTWVTYRAKQLGAP